MAHAVEPLPLETRSRGLDDAVMEAQVSSLEVDVVDLQAKSDGVTNYAIGGVIGPIIGAIAVPFFFHLIPVVYFKSGLATEPS